MKFFAQPLQIGPLRIRNRVILAPLAGVSDIPFRRICRELGAGLTYVEMLSAIAIRHRNKRTRDMMARHPDEDFLGVQVSGPTPELVEEAVAFVDQRSFDTIDLNMGCPVRKVVASGSGSALLKDPDRLTETVRRGRAATDRPFSVKFRLGFTRDSVNVEDTAERVVREGVDMFTVHGRARDENYAAPVDLERIRIGICRGRETADGPLVAVGNGDVVDFQSALRMREATECDAVMISRGALGNPWIFREILEERTAHPTLEEWGDVVSRHLSWQEEHYRDESLAAILSRKHLLWYIKGFPRNRELGAKLAGIESIGEAHTILREYAAQWPRDLRRFEGPLSGESRFGPSSKYDPKYEMDRTHDRGVGALE